jgi:hypothetical protein
VTYQLQWFIFSLGIVIKIVNSQRSVQQLFENQKGQVAGGVQHAKKLTLQ